MRAKLLRADDGGTVLLAYPETRNEYDTALRAAERLPGVAGRGGHDAGREGLGPADGGGVVTTVAQRERWGLPDLTTCGQARLVDETQVFGLLVDGSAEADAVNEAPPDGGIEAGPPRSRGSAASALADVRALVAPDVRIDEALGALEGAELPHRVRKTLRCALREALESEAHALEDVLNRTQMLLAMPWRAREPERFDRAQLKHTLDCTHGGLEKVKTRIVDVLASCPQAHGPLTVEGVRGGRATEPGVPPPLVVRPGPGPVLCLAGPHGTGKMSLAVSIAAALDRTLVHVTLNGGNAESLLRGVRNGAPGRIARGLHDAGVANPVFVLDALDRVDSEAADALSGVLDPARRKAFGDEYLDAAFDLSAVLWIVTATNPAAIPPTVRKYLELVELPGYGEEEKLVIAERYLLRRPFAAPWRPPSGWLASEPAELPWPAIFDTTEGPTVVVEREVSSVGELEALAAGPLPVDTAEAWRTAACAGKVRFEPEAIRLLIRHHTCEAGVAVLDAQLAEVCRHVVRHNLPGEHEPAVVTPAVVREALGDGDAAALPPAVEAAIARERRRMGEPPDSTAVNEWIECLRHLPWDRRSDAPIDLAQFRARLDAGHAGLDDAKTRILEHLAVCRRNPQGAGAVICLAGAPGVGKTSLAQCVAEALGRGFAKLSCGGLRDETDLRGHNRTWRDAQPGRILRELQRVGSRDPVFVLDEIDKIGDRPAGVLLEVLDPAQHARFHDAYVELPFDLSAVLFITTANEVARIPAALRDRIEVIELPGYTEAEKIAIAQTHLVPAQNRAAGLSAAPVRFTREACERIIRDHTSERGIRQLTRCLRTVCRKVALGLETGDDDSLVRERITAEHVRAYLGEPDAGRADGVEHLRAQLEDAALPDAVRVRGRQLLDRVSGLTPDHPDQARERECVQCLLSVPWTARSEAAVDLARARAVLDAGHAAHAAVKERLLDYAAVRLAKPDSPSPLLTLVGPSGVGKTSLARLVAGALGRACAWVPCGSLVGAAALHGARYGRPGHIVEELRRVGVRNPVFVLDEVDRLDAGAAAALLDAVAPGTAFRDHYLDLPCDLSEALFVATATRLAAVPPMLRERMRVIELPGYTDTEKRVIATRNLWPLQLARHGLADDRVRIGAEALDAVIRGYAREAGVWDLAGALGALCASVVRRRAEAQGREAGDGNAEEGRHQEEHDEQHEEHEGQEHERDDAQEETVEVTPQSVVEMLGAPEHPGAEVADPAGRPGVAVGLCWTPSGGGGVVVVEATRMPGFGSLTLTGRLGEAAQESARTALSWMWTHAGRYGLDPALHRNTDVHLNLQSGAGSVEGTSAGIAMAAALVSAFTERPLRGGIAMTGVLTLSGHVLPVGGIAEKVLAAHRRGLARVILPEHNRKQVDEELGDDVRSAVAVDYVTRVDELLDLVLQHLPAADAAVLPAGRVS